MSALLLDYLPLVIFIAVALVIGLALLVAPLSSPTANPILRSCPAYDAGSTPSTMPA